MGSSDVTFFPYVRKFCEIQFFFWKIELWDTSYGHLWCPSELEVNRKWTGCGPEVGRKWNARDLQNFRLFFQNPYERLISWMVKNIFYVSNQNSFNLNSGWWLSGDAKFVFFIHEFNLFKILSWPYLGWLMQNFWNWILIQ